MGLVRERSDLTDFERKLKRLSAKDWKVLRPAWLDHIPEIQPPGCKPAEVLAENDQLRREVNFVRETGEHRFVATPNPAGFLFHESMFLTHKAIRVWCAAAHQAASGLPTWSISTAHQSSMLSVRALLGLCGIAYIEVDNQYFLVDSFPAAPKGRRALSPAFSAADNEIQMLRIRDRMGHQHWWDVLQRLLRTSADRFSCWSYPFHTELQNCDAGVLTRHRNRLHYDLSWFHGDLFENHIVEAFIGFDSELVQSVVEETENDESNITLILNMVLLGNVISMIADLSTSSSRVAQEFEVMRATVQRFSNETIDAWTCGLGSMWTSI